MENIFNEEVYRNYLENKYVWPIDKNNPERKIYIDRYSSDLLQKIIDDTKEFIIYIINELRKEKDNLIDSVSTKVELVKSGRIESNLHGGWPADRVYNPDGFDSDFYVSDYLLNSFFRNRLYIDYEDIEYYNEEESAGSIVSVPYIYIAMKKEDFNDYENINSIEELMVKRIRK